jgi:hypothetical protein
MHNKIPVEIVASKHALGLRRTAGTALLWVGESDEGRIQIAFHPPGDLLLTADADRAAEQFYKGYLVQSLMNGDDSAETQIRETRRFWAELLSCTGNWHAGTTVT